MALFFNSNSLLLTGLFLEVLAAWYFFRHGFNRDNLLRWFIVAGLIAAGFLSLRPSATSGRETAEITALIGQGAPVLVEFKSPN